MTQQESKKTVFPITLRLTCPCYGSNFNLATLNISYCIFQSFTMTINILKNNHSTINYIYIYIYGEDPHLHDSDSAVNTTLLRCIRPCHHWYKRKIWATWPCCIRRVCYQKLETDYCIRRIATLLIRFTKVKLMVLV